MTKSIMERLSSIVEEDNSKEPVTEMSQAERDKLPDKAFVFPDRDAWPIHDAKHALTAINYMKAGRGDEKDYPEIKKAIKAKWGKNKYIMKALAEV